jgi:hypothetical protein
MWTLWLACSSTPDSAPAPELVFSADSDACEVQEVACDGLDEDCDGAIDEGLLVTFYEDQDGDGYGALEVQRCPTGEAGWSLEPGDCDDGDAAVHPGAAELCNELDDDCDGATDEELEPPWWYVDADGDGYGDADQASQTCLQPEGSSERSGDCDDSDAEIHPGAFETCGDDMDEDCDGVVDEVSVCCIATTPDVESYVLCTEPRSWAEAEAACLADGWVPVVVDDQAENAWVFELVSWLGADLWLGLTDRDTEGTWLTSEGEPPPWYGWQDGEPNNHTGTNAEGQDCAGFVLSTEAWHDLDCEGELPYLCER